MNPQPGRPTVSVSRPPTNPFCRFLVLAVGLLSAAAAMMKSRQYVRLPAAEHGQWEIPDFVPVLITFEIFLGLWLMSGAFPAAARRVAIGCFGSFACYTLFEAFAGKTDCGCFGQVHVNPWYTFILDVSLVLMLTFFGKPGRGNAGPSRWAQRKWPVALAAAIGLAIGFTVAILHPKVVSDANGLAAADNGRIVILEPHKWLHHRLPVLGNIVAQGSAKALGNRLSFGRWIVMFYHASCDECQQTIPVYEALAQREMLSGKAPHVAFVRVPSNPPNPVLSGLFDSRVALHGTLDTSHQWFATTPIVVELRGGIVHRVATGRSAMTPRWMNTAAHHRETTGGIGAVQ